MWRLAAARTPFTCAPKCKALNQKKHFRRSARRHLYCSGDAGVDTASSEMDNGVDVLKQEKIRELRDRSLRLPSFAEADLAAALAELKTAEDLAVGHADDNTMLWFLKDRDLDVGAAAEKCRKYNEWREVNNYQRIDFDSIKEEYSTGKALLLEQRDLLGRQVVSVKLTKHVIAERDLEDTKRLTVFLLDQGLQRIHEGAARGEPDTVLVVFDLRGFSTANADIDFLKFFIKCIFTYFPKRVSQVLFIEAPLVFRPVWGLVKPWLGKYSSLVRFVSVEEANEYFQDGAGVFQRD